MSVPRYHGNVLFLPEQLLSYTECESRGEVPVENKSGALYVSTSDGRQWVRKGVVYDPFSTLSEAIVWHLARVLRVPVPDGAILWDGRTPIWMSEFKVGANQWSPADASLLSDTEQMGRVIALDLLTCNEDRHTRNLLSTDRDEGGLDLWAIDHDAARCSSFHRWDDGTELRLPSVSAESQHVLKGVPRGYFDAACEQAAAEFEKAAHSVLLAALGRAYDDLDQEVPSAVEDVLCTRLSNLCEMMARYLEVLYR